MDLANFPASATAVNFEYTVDNSQPPSASAVVPATAAADSNNNSANPVVIPGGRLIQTKTVRLERVHLVSVDR